MFKQVSNQGSSTGYWWERDVENDFNDFKNRMKELENSTTIVKLV